MSDAKSGDPDDTIDETREYLAADRTVLANERTLAAWLRTAMAALATGVAVARLYQDADPPWLAPATATALVAMSLILVLVGLLRYRKTMKRLEVHYIETASRLGLLSASLLFVLGALAVAALIWLL